MKTWEQREIEAEEKAGNTSKPTLLQARIRARKTQREMAVIAGLSHQGYRCIENNVYACADAYYEKIKEAIGDFERTIPPKK